jgi:hypothetical protein
MFRNIERIFFVVIGIILATVFTGIFGDDKETETKQAVSTKESIGKLVIKDDNVKAWKPSTLEAGEYKVIKAKDDRYLLANGYYVDKAKSGLTYSPNKKAIVKDAILFEDVREHVFQNQIPSMTRYNLKNDWETAKVFKIILTEGSGEIVNHEYVGKQVYRIEYLTNLETNPTYVVYVSMDKYEIVGYKNKIK